MATCSGTIQTPPLPVLTPYTGRVLLDLVAPAERLGQATRTARIWLMDSARLPHPAGAAAAAAAAVTAPPLTRRLEFRVILASQFITEWSQFVAPPPLFSAAK